MKLGVLPVFLLLHLEADEAFDHLVVQAHVEAELGKTLQRLAHLLLGVLPTCPLTVAELKDLGGGLIVRLDEVVDALLPSHLDQIRVPKLPNVMVDGLWGHSQLRCNLAHGHLLSPQEENNPTPCLVAHQLKGLGILNHFKGFHVRFT